MLLAYSRIETVSSLVLAPLPKASILKAKSLIYRLNRREESEQPCFKPHFTLNQSVVNPLSFTEHKTLIIQWLNTIQQLSIQAKFFKFCPKNFSINCVICFIEIDKRTKSWLFLLFHCFNNISEWTDMIDLAPTFSEPVLTSKNNIVQVCPGIYSFV